MGCERLLPRQPLIGHAPACQLGVAPAWLARGVELPGRVLGEVGLAAPAMFPEQLLLLRATAV